MHAQAMPALAAREASTGWQELASVDSVGVVITPNSGAVQAALPVVHSLFLRLKTFPIITLIGNYLAGRA